MFCVEGILFFFFSLDELLFGGWGDCIDMFTGFVLGVGFIYIYFWFFFIEYIFFNSYKDNSIIYK